MSGSFRKLVAIAIVLLVLVAGALWWHHRNSAPHSVTLTWQAPPAVNGTAVVAYNLYRRTAEEDSYVSFATRVPETRYVDRSVKSGRIYFYAVTSIDQAGRESRFSTTIKVAVP